MQKILSKLQERAKQNTLRQLPVPRTDLVDFCSNDYLGLAQNSNLFQNINNSYSAHLQLNINGATGSRLISGNSDYAQKLEQYLADFFQAPSALLFNSGYAANMGVFSSIPQKGDTVLYDELCHACIKDGIRLSFADRYPFRHNDLDDLEKKIKKSKGDVYVAVETIYSMDGDQAPLAALVQLRQKYGIYIIADEAHSTGIMGCGAGMCCELGIENDIFIKIYTFGKAMGAHGAVVAGSDEVTQYLVNFSRPFIYTTALPLHNLVTIRETFAYLQDNQHLITTLNDNVSRFKSGLAHLPFIQSTSPIQAWVLGNGTKAKSISQTLALAGFDIKAILAPTVREGTERLRYCIHAFNTYSQIDELKKYF
ncbi:MAG: pyridoxal phosphate-dependent aminotransferase family protein [Cytophagales bacterium]|nr:pyridoxal phosphate-dependent aminotransferase family protein [Cytophagales bacterium]